MADALGIAALVVAAVSVLFAWRTDIHAGKSAAAAVESAAASERAARVAEESDRRARIPQLTLRLDHPAVPPTDRVIYHLRNEGPQDLNSLVVYRPRVPRSGIKYPIAPTGKGGYADDEVDLGPLRLSEEASLTFCCGAADDLPEFRVRIECRSGLDTWTLTRLLPTPRGAGPPK